MILATENFLTDWNRHAFGKPSQRRRACVGLFIAHVFRRNGRDGNRQILLAFRPAMFETIDWLMTA